MGGPWEAFEGTSGAFGLHVGPLGFREEPTGQEGAPKPIGGMQYGIPGVLLGHFRFSLGPPWGPVWAQGSKKGVRNNVFFEDAQQPVHDSGFDAAFFADDLNCYKDYHDSCSNVVLHEEMKACQ